MSTYICDVENSVSYYGDGDVDNTPYNKDNKLVSVGFRNPDSGETFYKFLQHDDISNEELQSNKNDVQRLLDDATLIVGHHFKYDLVWLRECGFHYNGPVWDTGIFDYVYARGIKVGLSLDACCERHKIDEQKLDTLQEYWAKGINTNQIPRDKLEEYGVKDLILTQRLYLKQLEKSNINEKNIFMMKAVKLMNDFLPVLADMERAGVAIDVQMLSKMKENYKEELEQLNRLLKKDVKDVMGDTPFNLNSPDDLCAILYSRTPRDKGEWKRQFNIGSSNRGSVKKANKVKRLGKREFGELVNDMTIVKKTIADKCSECEGSGKAFQRHRTTGEPTARLIKCKSCTGTGVVYLPKGDVAGFKLTPLNEFASANGFSLSKGVINIYLGNSRTPVEARNFLEKLSRYNKVTTWVNTFISNIEKYQKNGILRSNFSQTVTATGRLASSRPNLQNQSKRDKSFEVRKAFKSRFDGGKLYEADFGQLEFRIAALLSGCRAAKEAIINGLDIHAQTRSFYHGEFELKPKVLQPDMTRQQAKAETFGPLYGKMTEWTNQFYKLYPGIEIWHKRIMNEALTTKEVRSPSGRIYAFPDTRPFEKDGRLLVSGHTQIKNYGVQGFATGDIVLLVLIDVDSYLKFNEAKSVLNLQVHDSAMVDAHPDEFNLVTDAFYKSFEVLPFEIEKRFNIVSDVPLAFDLECGYNWLEMGRI